MSFVIKYAAWKIFNTAHFHRLQLCGASSSQSYIHPAQLNQRLRPQAAATLTCETCGEELLLEDMGTHVLLNHLDKDMYCPLCPLSGVSFDELCGHLSSAHPDSRAGAPPSGCLDSPDQEGAPKASGCSSRTAGEAEDLRSAGTPAPVPSALARRDADPSWDAGRERPEDDDAEEPASSPAGLSLLLPLFHLFTVQVLAQLQKSLQWDLFKKVEF